MVRCFYRVSSEERHTISLRGSRMVIPTNEFIIYPGKVDSHPPTGNHSFNHSTFLWFIHLVSPICDKNTELGIPKIKFISYSYTLKIGIVKII